MPDRTYSASEKLAEIEGLIEDFRWARSLAVRENQTYRILKQIAKELRAAQGLVPNEALASLMLTVDAAKRAKTTRGIPISELEMVAWSTIENWPAIKLALEGSK